MNIVIMGPVGAGKSTQAELLAKRLNLPVIDTGEIYRLLAKEASPLGQKIKAIVDSGGLVDDDTTFSVVARYLAGATNGFVMDGFPRTLAQAQKELVPIDNVIYLRLTDEEARKRLALRHRVDDNDEIVINRLKLYHETTEPVLDFYRQQGKLIEVDGSPSVPEIETEIVQALKIND